MEAVKYPIAATWVAGKRNGTKVLVDPYGNRLIKKSEYGDNYFYWCGRKDIKCPVRVTLNSKVNELVSGRGEHNHDTDRMLQVINNKKKQMIENAKNNPTVAPRVLFKDLTNSILSSPITSPGIGRLPKQGTLTRTINRKRKLTLGPLGNLPRDWSEYTIPDRYKVTAYNQPFCILDHETANGMKIWGFMSPDSIQVAQGSSQLWVDGTFEIVNKTLFTQLWIVTGRSENTGVTIPLAYFLLPNKQPTSYEIVLRKLQELGVVNVDVFHIDFESGAVKAILTVYKDVRIEGCDVHWKRRIREGQSRVGLLQHSDECITIQSWIRMLWSLCYVPVSDVVDVYEQHVLPKKPDLIVEDQEDVSDAEDFMRAIRDFVEYFEGTWIGKFNTRSGKRGSSKFKLAYWNHYECVAEGDGEVTNNYSEAYNSQMKLTIGGSPNLYAILQALKDEEAIGHSKIANVLAGNDRTDPNPARTKKYEDKKRRIKSIVDQYGKVSLNDYFEALMSHFND